MPPQSQDMPEEWDLTEAPLDPPTISQQSVENFAAWVRWYKTTIRDDMRTDERKTAIRHARFGARLRDLLQDTLRGTSKDSITAADTDALFYVLGLIDGKERTEGTGGHAPFKTAFEKSLDSIETPLTGTAESTVESWRTGDVDQWRIWAITQVMHAWLAKTGGQTT